MSMICTYTIMGDVSQNIHFGYGLNDWEELKALFFLQVRDRKELIGKAAGICRKWQEKGLDTIAVVLRDRQSAETVAEELGQYIEVIDSDLEKAVFGSGIMVLPVEYTKGLEFDAVLILDPDRQDYPVDDGHAKLLYVAATRALHELCVRHTENLTGLIADPIPERAEESRCQDLRHETEVKRERDKQEKEKQKNPISVSAPTTKKKVAIVKNQLPQKMPVTREEKKTAPDRDKVIHMVLGKQEVITEGRKEEKTFAFGDMPATEILRPAGHAKIDLAIRWVTKQSDGLYIQSRYGVLRLSPVGSAIIRVTFVKSPLSDKRQKAAAFRETEGESAD